MSVNAGGRGKKSMLKTRTTYNNPLQWSNFK